MHSNNKPNRLVNEKSPYLLQHAHNPVNWYPWSEEAFEKAKKENKPIFLSIGYSTCHWCHVMAHESFEDIEVAGLLNQDYIAIKVDREERPDVDSIYMKVCQMMTGHGGWPLTIIMTPDQFPFYAGTYFPKESKYGRPGLIEVLEQLARKYKQEPDHIQEVTESVKNALERTIQIKSNNRLGKNDLEKAYQQLGNSFDMKYGGFGDAPKFPQPQNLLFLMRYYHFTNNKGALQMAESTLIHMANGGIYDHIGFGFARYSTDDKWLVPHFEKMLYDNALLLMAYTECFQITKDPFYKKISMEMITFLEREMLHKDGGFYSAIDADSEGVEGKYYVWDPEEIDEVLGEDLGELFADVYRITPYGNFERKNIPNLIGVNTEEMAKVYGMSLYELEEQLELAREKLLEAREKRVYPHVDDKILTSWNAMAAAALAKAGKVFQQDHYIDLAEKTITFIEEKLYEQGRLMGRYRDGETKYKAYLDDYAYLFWAYLELYEATFKLTYLQKATNVAEQMINLFWDNENGGFFFTGKDSEQLIAQDKEIYDGALPSGNSVACVMLTRLGFLTGKTKYLELVEEMYSSFYDDISRTPSASSFFMQSLLLTEFPTKEVVMIGENAELIQRVQQQFLPNVVFLMVHPNVDVKSLAPFASEYKQKNNEPTIYVCENFACQQPTNDLEEGWRNIIS